MKFDVKLILVGSKKNNYNKVLGQILKFNLSDNIIVLDYVSNEDLVNLSRSLEIDIAVDLGGHTANSRTKVFAMSLAPIQLSYIGYLGTLGTDYYDYLIADEIIIPKENQKHYSEKII